MNNLIEVRDLRLSYGHGRQRVSAVQGISFTVAKGECVGFIGANGAGKSTTIKAMMGFMYPDAGDARLFGFPSGDPKGRRHVGYLPEVALYYPFMKASELITLYGALSGTSHPTYGCVVRQDAFQLYVSRGFLRIRAVREAYPVLIEALHNPQQREQVRLAQLDFRTGAELGLRVRPRDRVAAPPGATAERYAEHFPDLPTP